MDLAARTVLALVYQRSIRRRKELLAFARRIALSLKS
jgi:hypothetical protein